MNGAEKGNTKEIWAVGGGLLLGLGIGLMLLPKSALLFVGSLIAGLGIGLIITAVLSGFAHK